VTRIEDGAWHSPKPDHTYITLVTNKGGITRLGVPGSRAPLLTALRNAIQDTNTQGEECGAYKAAFNEALDVISKLKRSIVGYKKKLTDSICTFNLDISTEKAVY
jgi:hypothetical protein